MKLTDDQLKAVIREARTSVAFEGEETDPAIEALIKEVIRARTSEEANLARARAAEERSERLAAQVKELEDSIERMGEHAAGEDI